MLPDGAALMKPTVWQNETHIIKAVYGLSGQLAKTMFQAKHGLYD